MSSSQPERAETTATRNAPASDFRKAKENLVVALPEPNVHLPQNEEWLVVELDGEWRRIGMHNYGQLYAVPGLYEKVIYDILGCDSPATVRNLLAQELEKAGVKGSELTVLDLGAGNGCVAEELTRLGARRFVGVDICPESVVAAERDRPGLYQEYVVADLTDLTTEERQRLEKFRYNAFTCVAALGFGDIPPEAFAEAYNLVDDGGWIAFTIKRDFIDAKDPTGFAKLIRRMLDEGVLELANRETFKHRVSTAGDPLLYVAFIGRKRRDISPDLLS